MSESIFKMGTLAEEQKKQTEYIPLKANFYLLEVFNAEWVQSPSYNDKSVMVDQIKVTFKAVKPVDGSPLEDMNGNPPTKNLLSDWFNPDSVGFNRKTNKPHKTRSAFTAIMNIPVEAELELKSIDDLVGRKVKAYVELVQRADGTFNNKLDKYSPVTDAKASKKAGIKAPKVEEGEEDVPLEDLPF